MHPNDHLKLIIGDLVMQIASLRAAADQPKPPEAREPEGRDDDPA